MQQDKDKNPAASKPRRSIREWIPSPDFLQWVFPTDPYKFYYCHVQLDWLTIEMTPPDVFTMAYEGGLNLIGINTALNAYISMLQGGGWIYFLPHYYFIFNCPKKYEASQRDTFTAMSSLIPLIAEDLYTSGYYISRAGGGLANYLHLIIDQHQQVSLAEVNALKILNNIHKSKEFTFVEFNVNDPTYGNQIFNNLSYSKDNTNFSDDATTFFGINWNIFNPQRFEEWIKPHISKVYDISTDMSKIYSEQQITANNTSYDTLSFNWTVMPDETGTSVWAVTEVNFSWNISENREKSNMIIQYKNKPSGNRFADTTECYWVLKGNGVEQFFRAGSFFLWHPTITNYLYELQQFETGRTLFREKRLWPNKIKLDTQGNFVKSLVDEWNYGSALKSGMGNYLQSNLSKIGGSSAPSGTVECN